KRFVYAVGGGRVRAVAIASRSLAGHRARLRAAMRRFLIAHASQAAPTFVPNATPGSSRLTGKTLVGSSDPRVNEALAVLCGLKH
ncbi:MAG: hypothetical protein QOD53_2249, partial [Thermoleophilaceae bacterium]|nr:hypothetical protein [Thermoleophilaceae bacterium]